MKTFRDIIKTENGAALILVLFLVAVISISSSALIINSLYSTENAYTSQKEIKALERARGGVEEALYLIDQKVRARQPVTNFTIGSYNEYYEATVTVAAGKFVIQSKAHYPTLLGEKFVKYDVNGDIIIDTATGLGSFTSDFFNYAVVTQVNGNNTTFYINDPTSITMNGIVKAKVQIMQNGNDRTTNFTSGWQIQSPMSTTDYNTRFQALKTQANNSYPQPPANVYGSNNLSHSYSWIPYRDSTTYNSTTYANDFTISAGRLQKYTVTVNGNLHADKITLSGYNIKLIVNGNLYVKNLNMTGADKLVLQVNGNIYCANKMDLNATNSEIYATGNVYVLNKMEVNGPNARFTAKGSLIAPNIKTNSSGSSNSDYVEINVGKDLINLGTANNTFQSTSSSGSTKPLFKLNVAGLFISNGVNIVINKKAQIKAGYIVSGGDFYVDASTDSSDYLYVGGIAARYLLIQEIRNITIGTGSGGPPTTWVGDTFVITNWQVAK